MKGASRASICSWISGDIGVIAVDPAEHVRGQELVMVGGEMRVERSAQLISLLLYAVGVDLKHGSTADQGRTGREDSSSRLWRLARALGTHAKQSPSTGHSAVGLRPGRETVSCTPRPHFTAPSCTRGNRVVGASDGSPFREERRPTRICRTPGTGCGLLAEASTLQMSRNRPLSSTGQCIGWIRLAGR